MNQRFARSVSGMMPGRPGAVGFEHFETSRFTISPIPVEFYRWTYGATTLRQTSADQTLPLAIVDVGSYTPEAINRTEIDFSQEHVSENLIVTVAAVHPVALLFRTYAPIGKVGLTIFVKHRSDPEERTLWVGFVISCQFEGAEAKLTCAPLSNVFQRRIPSVVYEPQCNWSVYSTPCGVAKAAFKTAGTVTAVAGLTVSAAAWGTKPDGWFTNGWVEIVSTGERRWIVDHVGTTLTLMNAFSGLAVGSSLDAYAGCDRTEGTCASKFNNLVNHMGFARIPSRNPYGGGSLV